MSPHIGEIFDLERLDDLVASGHVRVQQHPSEPLEIYNYTEKTQYEGVWNAITTACRGLIVGPGGEVVARPFAKFFNYGDPLAGELDLTAAAEVVDKLDGSLGILYPTSDGYAVATRGSFTSLQAIHATAVFRQRYGDFEPPEDMTVLFEIVYPENRIVCDYGGADDLFLLGAVDIPSGEVVGPDWVSGWSGPQATVFSVRSLGEALAMPPRPGAEGLVVRLVESGRMVKLKQADYLALHKIVTGLNARGVWEALGEGQTVAGICEPLPDEFHAFVREVADGLQAQASTLYAATVTLHEEITKRLAKEHPDGWERKHYADWATRAPHPAWLFNLLDGRDPRPAIWKTLRPSGDVRPVNVSEDAA